MTDYDVIVVGAGPSGVLAALAAAREGAQTLLIERSGMLGGSNTASLVCPLMTFHAGETQVVAGLAQQVVDRLAACGGTLGHIPDPLGVTATLTPIEPTLLTQVYFAMLRQAPGLRVLLHATLTEADARDGHIQSVVCVHKGGVSRFSARVLIDATGDGDLAALAGAPYHQGRESDGLAQPMSMLFKLGHVDYAPIRAAMRREPEQFVLRKGALEQPYTAVSGFFELVRHAKEAGELTVDRDRVLLFQGVREDEAIVNMSRVIRKRSTDAEELTEAELEARAQVDELTRFFRRFVPGCSQAYLAQTGACVGVRESRRIVGQYTLTEQDIQRCRSFEDSVACCAFPIDIHDPLGAGLEWHASDTRCFYDVPYRVMLPRSLDNLLVTGRCASATHEAMASLRITATAMAMGEAAGVAAGMASREKSLPMKMDAAAIQRRILAHGGIPGRAYLG